ncbi:hypothetical protein NQ176_g5363 [Zarea fungicola]|uniref:Uncharacterized protein n=1 Tax=Zarea fungicola TaxID=93591 RepID=A0ACC1N8V8_9HYPO|nr:hypothetical protein NQ176_g5363 [Lecanicillium fungicola]
MPSQQQILSSEVILEKYGSSLAGKTILVTGVAADSIGGELAVQLSTAKPALLILSARSQDRVESIVAKIKANGLGVATRFLKMDLGNLSSVREAAASLKDIPTIDHVVASAGVMLSPYGKTVDGIETHFAINYVANFLLVKLLLSQVEAAGPASSIIVVASSEVRAGKVNFDDVNFNDGNSYNPQEGYRQSNAARVMFIKKLAAGLGPRKIRVHSIDPGAVRTGLQRFVPPEAFTAFDDMRAAGQTWTDLDGREWILPEWTTVSEGAATIVTGMIDPTIENFNGSFLHNNAVADEELTTFINNVENWDKLWALSEKLIGESFSLTS